MNISRDQNHHVDARDGAPRRALVTGGAGFIGSHLVRQLLAAGSEVVVLDNLSTGRRENVPAAARLVEADILDQDAVRECAAGCDAAFHLAARVAIRSSFEFARDDAMTNVAGTASVVRACSLAGTVRKIVAASSMAVYRDAPARLPVTEDHPTDPVSPYGVSKLASERLTHLMCREAGMRSVVLRLFNTYGAGQLWSPYVGVVTIFVNKLLRAEEPVIFGDGEQRRDFVHAADVARAFRLAAGTDATGETFNIGSGAPLTINDVFAHIRRCMNSEIEPRHVPPAAGELLYSVADITRARRALGYEPRHVFSSSLDEVIDEISDRQKPPSTAASVEPHDDHEHDSRSPELFTPRLHAR